MGPNMHPPRTPAPHRLVFNPHGLAAVVGGSAAPGGVNACTGKHNFRGACRMNRRSVGWAQRAHMDYVRDGAETAGSNPHADENIARIVTGLPEQGGDPRICASPLHHERMGARPRSRQLARGGDATEGADGATRAPASGAPPENFMIPAHRIAPRAPLPDSLQALRTWTRRAWCALVAGLGRLGVFFGGMPTP